MAIVGYDDIDFAAAAAVPLSSVRQPREQLGRTAAELLLEEVHDARHARAPPRASSSRSWWSAQSTAGRRWCDMRVALFITCLADVLFPRVGQATVALLERLGHEVVFPAGQTCCGQMHINTGYQREACRWSATTSRSVFDRRQLTTRSWRRPAPASASVRHQHAAVAARAGDAGAGRPGRRSWPRARTSCPSSSSTCSGVDDVGAYYPHRVTYHPTCHSLRLLRVGDRPLRLLRAVRGIDLVELPDADQCCGFGGTFALKNADTSTAMLADKMRHVLATGAEAVCAGDCLLPDAHRRRACPGCASGTRPVHLAEILAARRYRTAMPAPAAGSRAHRDARSSDMPAGPGGAVPGPTAPRGVGALRGDRRSPRPPARRWPTPSCGATSATPPRTIRAKRAAVVAEVPDWEELRLAGQAIKAATMARLDEHLRTAGTRGHRARRHRALGARRGRGQPRSSPTSSGPPAPTRSSRSSRWRPRRSASTRRSPRRASPPGRPTSPS